MLIWRLRHVSNRSFVLFLSVIVGLAAGLSAVIIKNSVHLIKLILQGGFDGKFGDYLILVLPIFGIFLAVLFIKYVNKHPVNHGVPGTLYAISSNNGIMKRHNMFSSIITSTLTVGFGGSVGLEGPTVSTGAAIGSNLGRLLHLNYRQIVLLLGCAAAGAMSAIFKSPVAAIVFVLEVIMLDLTMSSLLPLLLASVSAVLTSYLFFGQDVLYAVNTESSFTLNEIPLFIILGVLAGLMSVYFTRSYMFIGRVFENIKKQSKRLIIGGFSLGVLIFLFPALYGEGYEIINMSLEGDFSYIFEGAIFKSFSDSILVVSILLLLIVLLKVIATSVTFGSGGVGGIFAPTLFIGANFGLLFATIHNHFSPKTIDVSNYALIGMGGMIAGVLHAPLTAIFLIAEITGGYELIIPLMITAAISYVTIKSFESNSVYTIQLAKRKQLITHDKDKSVLSFMKVTKLIEKDFLCIKLDATLGDLVQHITKSSRNIFPVIDDENNFYGIVILDNIRHIMFKQEMYDNTYVRNLMIKPITTVDTEDSMEDVAQKFQKTGRYNIVVIKDGKYIGFISRARVFSSYRKLLKEWSDE
ncbi:chloride channel protein [Bacteroidota bacterium]